MSAGLGRCIHLVTVGWILLWSLTKKPAPSARRLSVICTDFHKLERHFGFQVTLSEKLPLSRFLLARSCSAGSARRPLLQPGLKISVFRVHVSEVFLKIFLEFLFFFFGGFFSGT